MATRKAKTRSVSAAAPARAESVGQFAQWFSNPAVRYVASGIATAVLAKIATNMAEKYPQISQLLREGLESVEGKLADFNGMGASEESEVAPRTRSTSRRSANAGMAATH